MYNRYEKQLSGGPPPKDKNAKRASSSANVGNMNNLVQDVLERQLRGANERLAALTQQKQESEAKWAAMVDESGKKVVELTQQNEVLKANQAKFDVTSNMQNKTIESLKAKLESRKRSLDKEKADNQQLSTLVNSQNTELNSLKSRLDAAQKQLDSRINQLERAEAEIKSLSAAKLEIEQSKRELEKRFHNLQSTLNDEIREVGRLRERDKDLYNDIERLTALVAQKDTLLAQKDIELAAERRRGDERSRFVPIAVIDPPKIEKPVPITPVAKVNVCTQTKSLDASTADSTDHGNGHGNGNTAERANNDAELRKKYEIALLEIRRLQKEIRKCEERFTEVQSSVMRLKQKHRRILEKALFRNYDVLSLTDSACDCFTAPSTMCYCHNGRNHSQYCAKQSTQSLTVSSRSIYVPAYREVVGFLFSTTGIGTRKSQCV